MISGLTLNTDYRVFAPDGASYIWTSDNFRNSTAFNQLYLHTSDKERDIQFHDVAKALQTSKKLSLKTLMKMVKKFTITIQKVMLQVILSCDLYLINQLMKWWSCSWVHCERWPVQTSLFTLMMNKLLNQNMTLTKMSHPYYYGGFILIQMKYSLDMLENIPKWSRTYELYICEVSVIVWRKSMSKMLHQKIEDTDNQEHWSMKSLNYETEWIDFVNINEEWLSEIFIIISKKVWIIE